MLKKVIIIKNFIPKVFYYRGYKISRVAVDTPFGLAARWTLNEDYSFKYESLYWLREQIKFVESLPKN